jgi:MFS family permease
MGIGVTVFAPFIAMYLIPSFSLSNAYLALGLILGIVIIPASLVIVRNRPADIGLLPDGATSGEAGRAPAPSAPEEGLSLRMALATPAFWLLAVALLLHHSHMGVGQSVVPHLGDIGFPVDIAASVVSTTAFMSMVGLFFFGWLCDRIPVKFAYVIGLVMIVVGIIVLLNIDTGSPVWMVWMYAAFFGFGASSWMTTMSLIVSTTFGLASYGAIFGTLNLFQSIGGASGPLLAGYIYDSTGSYSWAFLAVLAFIVLAMPLVLAVRRPAAHAAH